MKGTEAPQQPILESVSRETRDRLAALVALVVHWNRTINLISAATEAEIWGRHVCDSLQLCNLIARHGSPAIDIGSGAGFPGLIAAIATGRSFILVEADRRKAAFLSEAGRLTQANIRVIPSRVEDLTVTTEVLTARAVAPLSQLLRWSYPLMDAGAACLFLKGRGVQDEINQAIRDWDMNITLHPSSTHSLSSVIQVRDLRPRGGAASTEPLL